MKKKVLIFLTLICIVSVYLIGRGLDDSSVLLKSYFEKTGAEFIRMDIEGTGKMQTDETAEVASKKLFMALGFPDRYEIKGGLNSAELSFNRNGIGVVIKTRKLQGENLMYASLLYSQYSNDMNITNIRRSILNAFSVYNVKPSFSSLIQGKYNEALTISQMKEKAAGLFSSKEASFVEGVDDGNMVSFSGYISGLRDKISYMGKLVNLNTALRYSRADGCTYIWIGSPIILLEY